jgi:hypothetical protein
MMFEFRRRAVSRLVLICTLLTLPAQAWATDLTGAWASDVSQCGKVSKKAKMESYSNGIRTFSAPASLLTVTSLGEELPDARSKQESR